MSRVLVSWIGHTDLRAQTEREKIGLGPVAQAVSDRLFDEIVLLNNYPKDHLSDYLTWLQTKTRAKVVLFSVSLSGPTDFGQIYECAVDVVSEILKRHGPSIDLTFHLSPGTPAMAAVWIILAKTRFPAELIESSKEHGVRTASVPFDISAEFIPDLLRKPDRELERLSAGLPPEAPEFAHIIHRSAVMKRLVAKARKVAPRSVPILIEGESGTGKELLARAIHNASPRRDKPFIAVNCGAIPSELIESELFGHVKGAFTGADRARKGYFATAHQGTLFLDEVGELPLQAQVKLLRTLQEGEVVPVGATKPTKINVRVIAATNRTLTQEITTGAFRADLFYRLAVAILQIPPLRERPGDLSLLIDGLLAQINQESAGEPGYQNKIISASAKNLLLSHRWPGNVRELLNTLRRAAIWSEGASIGAEDIRDALLPADTATNLGILKRPLDEGFNLQALMKSVAVHYLERAMKEAHNNKRKAAEMLGLSNYQTLTNWLKKYGLSS